MQTKDKDLRWRLNAQLDITHTKRAVQPVQRAVFPVSLLKAARRVNNLFHLPEALKAPAKRRRDATLRQNHSTKGFSCPASGFGRDVKNC